MVTMAKHPTVTVAYPPNFSSVVRAPKILIVLFMSVTRNKKKIAQVVVANATKRIVTEEKGRKREPKTNAITSSGSIKCNQKAAAAAAAAAATVATANVVFHQGRIARTWHRRTHWHLPMSKRIGI